LVNERIGRWAKKFEGRVCREEQKAARKTGDMRQKRTEIKERDFQSRGRETKTGVMS